LIVNDSIPVSGPEGTYFEGKLPAEVVVASIVKPCALRGRFDATKISGRLMIVRILMLNSIDRPLVVFNWRQ
jgi:hypothetical protein